MANLRIRKNRAVQIIKNKIDRGTSLSDNDFNFAELSDKYDLWWQSAQNNLRQIFDDTSIADNFDPGVLPPFDLSREQILRDLNNDIEYLRDVKLDIENNVYPYVQRQQVIGMTYPDLIRKYWWLLLVLIGIICILIVKGILQIGNKSYFGIVFPSSQKSGSLNKRESVIIGQAEWMIINLNQSTFRNGDIIPEAKSDDDWKTLCSHQRPAWCYYGNDPKSGKIYGKLYNYYAISDMRNLAPEGWHIPSEADWKKLTEHLGGYEAAGQAIKSTTGWANNSNGNNASGFNALPSGIRNSAAGFEGIGEYCDFWSNTELIDKGIDWVIVLRLDSKYIKSPFGENTKNWGFSCRCIKD